MKQLTLLLLFVFTINLSAQIERFPLLEPISIATPESFIIEGGENELIMFWIDTTDLQMSKSLDNGETICLHPTPTLSAISFVNHA